MAQVKLFRAVVKEKHSGTKAVIERRYTSKKKFIEELRRNGYKVDLKKVVNLDT